MEKISKSTIMDLALDTKDTSFVKRLHSIAIEFGVEETIYDIDNPEEFDTMLLIGEAEYILALNISKGGK